MAHDPASGAAPALVGVFVVVTALMSALFSWLLLAAADSCVRVYCRPGLGGGVARWNLFELGTTVAAFMSCRPARLSARQKNLCLASLLVLQLGSIAVLNGVVVSGGGVSIY